ncbi:PREDICTED: lariat debranching enzyme-like [Rhagoletis zephyria]|uniref:lariat debranching enzyme-like n=1 Tax=Rhagoletis zephyria TaxID=28612 RepID=UPI0008112382|nr:PREDICTED: lariat debranching enzyme-like [Rhagoletis zephyria]
MRVAVVGCLHGELDIIYEAISRMEQEHRYTIDLLLVCGDFQTIRNANDLRCIAVPDKYKRVGHFPDYYFGRKVASKLTLLIGGNHEASNYLQTLPYGGWVAPNMYYLGLCSVVRVGGLRLGGISGIFKYHHAKLSHFECLPYNADTMRSVYHMRETEIYKLLQLTEKLDVFLSHDWPINIHQCGNVGYLLRKKPFFRDEVNDQRLGNPLLQPLVHHLQPRHWFAAHLHVSFNAVVNHDNNKGNGAPAQGGAGGQQQLHRTQFQALDKVLPRRQFLQVFEIPTEEELTGRQGPSTSSSTSSSSPSMPLLEHDPEWLAILCKTDYLLKIHREQIHEIDIFNAHNSVTITEEDVKEVVALFNGDLTISPAAFAPCEPVTAVNVDTDPQRVKNFVNPQTTALCERLSILDPNRLFRLENDGEASRAVEDAGNRAPTSLAPAAAAAVANPDAISLSDDDDDCCKEEGDEEQVTKKAKLEEDEQQPPLFVIDTVGSK